MGAEVDGGIRGQAGTVRNVDEVINDGTVADVPKEAVTFVVGGHT